MRGIHEQKCRQDFDDATHACNLDLLLSFDVKDEERLDSSVDLAKIRAMAREDEFDVSPKEGALVSFTELCFH